jgi:hypothetical protein
MTSSREYDAEAVYEIRVRSQLDERWARRFGDMQIIPQGNGDCLITGPVADQAALYGLFSRLRDLGLVLVSVQRISHDAVC